MQSPCPSLPSNWDHRHTQPRECIFFLDLTLNSKVHKGTQGLAQLQGTNSQHTWGHPASWLPIFLKAGGQYGMGTQTSKKEQVSLLS